MKTLYVSYTVATAISALSVVFLQGNPANCATFVYKTATTETLYTERQTTRDGITYDGIFRNSIFDPFAMMFRQFSGLFSITEGSLGEAVAVNAVQTSPEDRTGLGEEGIARIEYFAFLQDVASLPNAVTVPPGLSEFDFKFVPAPIAGAPTVVSKGWEVASVPEPGTAIALGFLSGSMLMTKKGWHWGKLVNR